VPEDAIRGELVEQVLQLSEKTFRELAPLISKKWLQLDLTMPQLKVVYILFMYGSVRMGHIASELGVSLATATGVIDRLVEQDIVVRREDSSDRRVVLCCLTEKGQKLIGALWQLHQKRERAMLEVMDTNLLRSVKEALDVILQAELTMKETLQRPKQSSLQRETGEIHHGIPSGSYLEDHDSINQAAKDTVENVCSGVVNAKKK